MTQPFFKSTIKRTRSIKRRFGISFHQNCWAIHTGLTSRYYFDRGVMWNLHDLIASNGKAYALKFGRKSHNTLLRDRVDSYEAHIQKRLGLAS